MATCNITTDQLNNYLDDLTIIEASLRKLADESFYNKDDDPIEISTAAMLFASVGAEKVRSLFDLINAFDSGQEQCVATPKKEASKQENRVGWALHQVAMNSESIMGKALQIVNEAGRNKDVVNLACDIEVFARCTGLLADFESGLLGHEAWVGGYEGWMVPPRLRILEAIDE